MIAATMPDQVSTIQGWQNAWLEAFRHTLEGMKSTPFSGEAFSQKDPAAADLQAVAATGQWLRFGIDGQPGAELAFWLSDQDRLSLGQMVCGEPASGEALFAPEHEEALSSLVKTAADAAQAAWAESSGQPVRLKWLGNERPAWAPASQAGIRLKSAEGLTVVFHLVVSREASEGEASTAGQMNIPRVEKPAPKMSWSEMGLDANLELLMDVELDATLRFGQRSMPLKDILALGPGAVVELEQQVRDPAELLVGGKVVARGNVVVVDGNYGLQITELASPRERMKTVTTEK